MPVSHARDTTMTSTDEQAAGEVPGLLEVLARVPDPRKRRGRRFLLVFVLACGRSTSWNCVTPSQPANPNDASPASPCARRLRAGEVPTRGLGIDDC